jgi:hypothetical protein
LVQECAQARPGLALPADPRPPRGPAAGPALCCAGPLRHFPAEWLAPPAAGGSMGHRGPCTVQRSSGGDGQASAAATSAVGA